METSRSQLNIDERRYGWSRNLEPSAERLASGLNELNQGKHVGREEKRIQNIVGGVLLILFVF